MAVATTARDPVCGMRVDPATAPATVAHAGSLHHFCSTGCAERFRADPERYARGMQAPSPDADGAYTCPMHPEVRQQGPGSCPICGMALEPLEVTAEGPNVELIDMTRRFWISLVLSLPVVALEMGGHIPALSFQAQVTPRLAVWLQFV